MQQPRSPRQSSTAGTRNKTRHTILSPTCHPPSMLDFEMDRQKKCICSEAYLLYAGIWKDFTGGKVSISGDEVLQVLSASNMSDVSVYLLESASRVTFANNDADYVRDESNRTTVSWRIFIVLLSLAHQLSGLDLEAFLRQFKHPSSTLSSSDNITSAIADGANVYSSSSQSPRPILNVDHGDMINETRTILESPKPSGSADLEPMNSQDEQGDSIADGFQEYSNYFSIMSQPVLPPSVSNQSGDQCRSFPFREKTSERMSRPVLDHEISIPGKDQADVHNEKYPAEFKQWSGYNISSFDEGLIPAKFNTLNFDDAPQIASDNSGLQLAHPYGGPESAPIFLESTPYFQADPGLHLVANPPDSRTDLIVVEVSEHSKLELAHSLPESRSDPIPVHSQYEDASGLMLDDDWESVAASASEAMKSPSMIFEAEAPDVTFESRQIARNRLLALQAKEASSKPSERRNTSIFGRKKATNASMYPLPLLATALVNAAREGSLPLVATYIEFGADPNYRSKSPQERHNALDCAAAGGYSYIVDYLVHKGADAIAINHALIYAILRGHVNLAVKLISTYRANVNTFKNLPVKHKGTLSFSVGRVYANSLAVAAFITNKHDRVRMVRFLLSQNCEINNIIWFFFKTDENVEYGFGYSNLALFVPKCPESLSILLKAGIAAYTIRKEASAEVLKVFRKAGFFCDNLFIVQAISRIQSTSWEERGDDCLRMATQLVQNGADIDYAEFDGIEGQTGEYGWKMTPLARAVKGGSISGVKGLMKLGANPNSILTFDDKVGNSKSRTILHYAVQRGNIGIIQALISGGAAVDSPSNIYSPISCQAPESALARAASLGYFEIAKELLANRASPNDGSLHRAARNGHVKVVKLLLQYGAEIGLIVDGVSWPMLTEDNKSLWKENPDVFRLRRPRGNALCFAMTWPGARRMTSDEEKSDYIQTVDLLLSNFEARHLLIEQTVLRAALDANNIVGLERLLSFPFKYIHPGTNMNSTIFYISSSTMSSTAYGFTPVQYAMMMRCDNAIIDLLVSRGASKIRVIYTKDEMDTLLGKETGLIWEKCHAGNIVPKRVDGLEGAKEIVTHHRYGREWRPVFINKIKL